MGKYIILMLLLGLFCASYAIDLTNCSWLSNTSSTYDLLNDLTASGSSDCLDVNASNIIIDCHGYSITTAGGSGIHEGTTGTCFSNITIKNCRFLGSGGLYFQTGYVYGGMGCGYSANDKIYNNEALVKLLR